MRTRRTKEQIRKDNYNKDVDAYNFYVVNLDTKRAETGFEFKEDAVDVLNDYDDKKKYKVVSKRALKSMGIENPNESFKYEFGGDFQAGVYAKGGGIGDKKYHMVIQKENNYIYLKMYDNIQDRKDYGNRLQELLMTITNYGDVDVVTYTTEKQIDTEEKFETFFKNLQKKLNYANGGSLIGNQKRIDLNKNGKIDAEDFKIMRTTMNGGWRKDHKYVNSSNPKEDYEVIYARKYKPSRKGYKGKTNFADGGQIESAIKGYKEYTKKNWEGYDYFSEKYAVNELAELELDLRKLNDGKLAPSKVVGGGYKNAKKVAQDWLQSQIDAKKLAIKTNGLSNYINHRNFRSYLVEAKRENIINERKFNELLDESNEIMDSLSNNFAYGGGVNRFSEYSNDALYDMIINLSRYENTESDIQMVKAELEKRKGENKGVIEEMDLFDDKRLRLRKPVMPEKRLSKKDWAEKYNPRAYEFMGKDKMATGGGFASKDYDVIVKLPNGLTTKKDFEGFSKEEVIEWCKNRGWKYNSRGEKEGGYILKDYEFFVKRPRLVSAILPNSKIKMAIGGGVNVGYNVFNYTDDIYATDEVFKTKTLANKFIKEFRNRFVNQGYYRDNRMNKINIEDIDLLAIPSDFNPYKKYANGGGVGAYYIVTFGFNGDEGYQVVNSKPIFAKSENEAELMLKDQFESYEGVSCDIISTKKQLASGGRVSKFKMLSNRVAKNYEGKRVKPQYQKEYGKVYSKSEAKEVGDKVAGKVKSMQKMATGGEVGDKILALINPRRGTDGSIVEVKILQIYSPTEIKVLYKSTQFIAYRESWNMSNSDHIRKGDWKIHDETYKGGGKVANGGETKKGARGGIMTLAKKIRKDGESWQDAVKRAGQQLK